jgi:hypothetical protein
VWVVGSWRSVLRDPREPALEAELRGLAAEGLILSRHVFLDHVYSAIECVIWAASVLQDAIARGEIEP